MPSVEQHQNDDQDRQGEQVGEKGVVHRAPCTSCGLVLAIISVWRQITGPVISLIRLHPLSRKPCGLINLDRSVPYLVSRLPSTPVLRERSAKTFLRVHAQQVDCVFPDYPAYRRNG